MPTALKYSPSKFDSVQESILAIGRGEFIVVLDSEDRENEGDLIIAAEDMTTEKMAFMIEHTSGFICAPLTSSLATQLSLPQMVTQSTDKLRTAFTVSVDGSHPEITTGISAHDRALTCRMLAACAGASRKSSHANGDAAHQPILHSNTNFSRPGHVLPLQARDGGVLSRAGHTEAAVELCSLAGKAQVGVICELIERGSETSDQKAERSGSGMLRRDGCLRFAERWGLRVCTIEKLQSYRRGTS